MTDVKARSWFRLLGGLNQQQSLERVECPERSRGAKKLKFMAFDRQMAERNLREILRRIREIDFTIDKDILDYRQYDTLVDEADERRTMLDIREYLLRAYNRIDEMLTILDRYK